MASLTADEGIGAGEIHTHQPVGPGAAQSGVIERFGTGAGEYIVKRFADTGIIQRREPQPGYGPAPLAKLQHLAGDGFTFAVGVGGDYDT